jgi:hypothetical protein
MTVGGDWGLGLAGGLPGLVALPLGGVEGFDSGVGAPSFFGCFFGRATSERLLRPSRVIPCC